MSGSGREALPDVREWLGGPSGCPEVIGRHSRMSGSGWEDLPGDQKAFPEVWEWSGDPPGSPGVVGNPSRMSGCGREALLDVRE